MTRNQAAPSACLLCGYPTAPVEFAVAANKPWWRPMVSCSNDVCRACGTWVVADPDAAERWAFEANGNEPKFAHTDGPDGEWYVSTIYRGSSAPYHPHFYETIAFVRNSEQPGLGWDTVMWDVAGYPKRALRGHAILAQRMRRTRDVALDVALVEGQKH